MKRSSKGEEKVMGPMFPRLHVNDTDKGGPRAPPRNKMALYEQLSIPSQRFNSGVLPFNPNNSSKLPPPSSSQRSGHERVVYFPAQRPPSRQLADKPPGHSSDPNALLQQFELEKRTEEDDFTVPVFVNSNLGQANGTPFYNLDAERLSTSGRVLSDRPNKDLKAVSDLTMRRQRSSHNEENGESIPASREHKTTSNSPSTECRLDPLVGSTTLPEPVTGIDDDYSYPMQEFASEDQIISNDLVNDMESRENTACKSLPTGFVDRGDDLSETSVVETGMDISPDDVVGIIGLKRFWKARRAIVNQQRVFAIQVFELHRLIKVQRLIAGSPDSTLEDAAYLTNPLKTSSGKRIPLECIRESQSVPKRKNDSEKPNFRMECSAENTVGRASLSSVQNSSQLSSHRPFSGNPPPPTPATADSNTSPWSFQQPSGHQWLIPMMSPSEGLVYKPFPGPGFTSPICGGCGPPASNPMMGNFFAPTYGVPTPHLHYQGMGVPFAPSPGHGYFPPYGTAVTNPTIPSSDVEESNQYTSPGLQRQISGGAASFNIQPEDSSNAPTEKNRTVPDVFKYQASKDNELQASTASSPSERAHGTVMSNTNTVERRNMLSLFPTSPTMENPDNSPQACVPNHPARVIRVVPHNARSATESAARIFQSIQEERKQFDSSFAHL